MPLPPDKILIVDDEFDISAILQLHLHDAGYLTEWASDGEQALQLLRSDGHALVLLDVRMPGISGMEVLKLLRTDNNDTAVIMMTAHGNENLVTECMKAGAVDYVPKPFDIEDLLLRIQRAIDNRRIAKEKQLLEREKEDFFFMLSHDLKNPITAVIGSIDIVRGGRLGPVRHEQADYLQSAIESSEEVVAIIDNLLDIQRYNAGMMQTISAPVNPFTLLAEVAERFSPAARRDNIALTLNASADLAEIYVDSSVMARVIANLVVNALKFTPDGGSITLSCRSVRRGELPGMHIPDYVVTPEGFYDFQRYACICVSDTGSGIPPKEIANIFERYVQASNLPRKRGGAGLGLAFCKKAVKGFGGCIWAKNVEESGSEFIILLPCPHNDLEYTGTVQETHS